MLWAYKERLSANELEGKLNASEAVLIREAKACGKAESAKQLAIAYWKWPEVNKCRH